MKDIKIPVINKKIIIINDNPVEIVPLTFNDYVVVRSELSKNENEYMRVMKLILESCTDLDQQQINALTTSNALTLLIEICAISSQTGNKRDLVVKCSDCDFPNEISLDIVEDCIHNEIINESFEYMNYKINVNNDLTISNNREEPYCYVDFIYDGDKKHYLNEINSDEDYKKYCEFIDTFIQLSSLYEINEVQSYSKIIKKDYECNNMKCTNKLNELYLGTLTSFFI